MSSMFGGGFKASKCKTLLRLAMPRIKLLRNKRDIQIKQMRRDIAQLLSTGQEPSARIRVEHIAREQNIMAAYDIIELFCELIIVRLPIIESQKECPLDLKEAVSSLIFASPRCADLPELLQIRGLFASKYGKEFVAAAAELRPDCGVNRRIIEKLSVRAPSGEMKLKLLTEIAAEHNVNWDSSLSQAELMKQPEDLLDGPKNFYGPSSMPIPEPQPSPPPVSESVSRPQPSPRAPPATTPAPPAPPVHQRSSSESEEDTPSGGKEQFIPFVRPLHAKGASGEKLKSVPTVTGSRSVPKGSASGKHDSTVPEEDPYSRARKEGHMDYEKHGTYDNVAAAAKAAAESADRAVAAARAAAELAKTHLSKRESLSRTVTPDSESSSEGASGDEEHIEKSNQGGVRREGSFRTGDSKYRQENVDSSYRRTNSEDRREGLSRSNSEYIQEGPSRKSNQHDQHESLSRKNHSENRPARDLKPPRTFDSEEETFWRSGEQDWRQSSNMKSEKKIDSGFYSNQDDRRENLQRRDSDLFKDSESEEQPPRRPKESYSTSKLFGSNDSSSNLFSKSGSEEVELRSSDETPFYDSKSGFATPKFDEDELSYSKTSPFSNITEDISFRKGFDSPRSKPSYDEPWKSSSVSHQSGDGESVLRKYSSLGSDDVGSVKTRSGSNIFDTHLDESQGLPRGGSDSSSTRSYYYKGEDAGTAKYDDPKEPTSPIPFKSRRTRRNKDNLDSGGGSGGLPPPPGRSPKFYSENVDQSAPLSPEYQSPSESDNLGARRFDDSLSTSSKTSLPFFNSPPKASAPPDRPPPFPTSSAYQSPDVGRDSAPYLVSGSPSSRSSPSLERKDSPSAPPVHPKQPDYDDLSARFEALKGRAKW